MHQLSANSISGFHAEIQTRSLEAKSDYIIVNKQYNAFSDLQGVINDPEKV